MARYGGYRDVSFMRRINRSFINRTVGEEVGYYKISLSETIIDVYGDAEKKVYYNPVLITCLVGRQPQTATEMPYGTDNNQPIDFNFLRDDLTPIELVPEKGDIIMWQESYYEVDNVIENKFIAGKVPEYSLSEGLDQFGNSLSITCQAHLTHINRLNISQSR